MDEYDKKKKTRQATIFQLDFKTEIKPMLRKCGITNFEGASKKKAADCLLDFVKRKCDCIFDIDYVWIVCTFLSSLKYYENKLCISSKIWYFFVCVYHQNCISDLTDMSPSFCQ